MSTNAPIVLLLGKTNAGQSETVFGNIKRGRKENRKTVIVLGPKGSGKSSLVNTVTNYLQRVAPETPYRLHVAGKETSEGGLTLSPTTSVHSFLFHGSRLPQSLALIDTPPLGEKHKNKEESAPARIKKWYTSFYDYPSKDLEIWLVISAQQPNVGREFMVALREILEDLGALSIKVLPVITFAKNRKPVLAIKALDILGFNTQLENVDYFLVNNESVLPSAGCQQTNALDLRDSLRNVRALLIATTEPKVHIGSPLSGSSASSPTQVNAASGSQKSPCSLSPGSPSSEEHIYATPKKASSGLPKRPAQLCAPMQMSMVSISPYETIV